MDSKTLLKSYYPDLTFDNSGLSYYEIKSNSLSGRIYTSYYDHDTLNLAIRLSLSDQWPFSVPYDKLLSYKNLTDYPEHTRIDLVSHSLKRIQKKYWLSSLSSPKRVTYFKANLIFSFSNQGILFKSPTELPEIMDILS